MKKKLLFVLILLVALIVSGCAATSKTGEEFKKDYESVNGEKNKNGKEHRTLSIDSDNPFEIITAKELVDKIENKETFYVYFGDKLCPWCRSVIEKAIEIAKEKNINKIYYIAIWDDDGNEILRDKYEYKDGSLVKTVEGTDEYKKFLEYFDNVLSEYNVTTDNGSVNVGKRIYAPNFIYVEKGEAIRMVTGISSKQSDSREELTEEMLKDEEEIFKGFFK